MIVAGLLATSTVPDGLGARVEMAWRTQPGIDPLGHLLDAQASRLWHGPIHRRKRVLALRGGCLPRRSGGLPRRSGSLLRSRGSLPRGRGAVNVLCLRS